MGIAETFFFRLFRGIRAAWLRLLAWTGKTNPADLGCRS